MEFEPSQRLTAHEALRHPYFLSNTASPGLASNGAVSAQQQQQAAMLHQQALIRQQQEQVRHSLQFDSCPRHHADPSDTVLQAIRAQMQQQSAQQQYQQQQQQQSTAQQCESGSVAREITVPWSDFVLIYVFKRHTSSASYNNTNSSI